jgi:hypothetical protein
MKICRWECTLRWGQMCNFSGREETWEGLLRIVRSEDEVYASVCGQEKEDGTVEERGGGSGKRRRWTWT